MHWNQEKHLSFKNNSKTSCPKNSHCSQNEMPRFDSCWKWSLRLGLILTHTCHVRVEFFSLLKCASHYHFWFVQQTAAMLLYIVCSLHKQINGETMNLKKELKRERFGSMTELTLSAAFCFVAIASFFCASLLFLKWHTFSAMCYTWTGALWLGGSHLLLLGYFLWFEAEKRGMCACVCACVCNDVYTKYHSYHSFHYSLPNQFLVNIGGYGGVSFFFF